MIADALSSARAANGLPLVAAGDFNATADHRPFRCLLARSDLRDAVEQVNGGYQPTFDASGTRHWGIPLPPLVQIDHILTSAELAPVFVKTVDVTGADHRAVIAQLALAE
jgi:endonuclease/exonuclease/phosphatase family metal-dependent hydrolase